MEILIKEDERIDDLERNGYRIIQNRNKFCFGMDAVLLSGFAAEKEKSRLQKNKGQMKDSALLAADLGTGTGIIPLLVYGRLCQCASPEKLQIDALEIQEEMCDMAERSTRLNHLESRIHIYRGDLCQAAQILGRGRYDVVTSNPPYMKRGGGLMNPDDSKAISRHEVLCTFRDVAEQAAALLKPGGRLYLVHRPERLPELIVTLKDAGLEVKRMRMVHSRQEDKAAMVLLEAARGGGAFLTVEKPLIIYREQGVYTEEIRNIYYY